MDIVFYCPHCDQKIEAPSPYAGKNILCPNCKKEITVPSASSENTNIQLETEKEDENDSISEAISNNNQSSPPQYNEVVYTLLGIFFGLFGAHNLYKDQPLPAFLRWIAIILAGGILANGADITIAGLILGLSEFLVIVELGLQREHTTK